MDYKQEFKNYIQSLPVWQQDLVAEIFALIEGTDGGIERGWKWGGPVYESNGLICWVRGFKQFVNVYFFDGAKLRDPKGLLTEGKHNQAARGMRIYEGQQLNKKAFVNLIKQAVINNKSGNKTKFKLKPKQAVRIPKDLREAISLADLLTQFKDRPYYQRKDYVGWIEDAKLPETRERRIRRVIEELQKGHYMPPKDSNS